MAPNDALPTGGSSRQATALQRLRSIVEPDTAVCMAREAAIGAVFGVPKAADTSPRDRYGAAGIRH